MIFKCDAVRHCCLHHVWRTTHCEKTIVHIYISPKRNIVQKKELTYKPDLLFHLHFATSLKDIKLRQKKRKASLLLLRLYSNQISATQFKLSYSFLFPFLSYERYAVSAFTKDGKCRFREPKALRRAPCSSVHKRGKHEQRHGRELVIKVENGNKWRWFLYNKAINNKGT